MRHARLYRSVAVASALWASALTAQPEVNYTFNAVLVGDCYDGDTCKANIDLGFDHWLHDQSLRLACVAAPEVRGAERPDGLVVRDQLRGWMPDGSQITVVSEGFETGKFGRILAVIWYNGENMNARLVGLPAVGIEAYSVSHEAECKELLGIE